MNTISFFPETIKGLQTALTRGLLTTSLLIVVSCNSRSEVLVASIPETYISKEDLVLHPLEGKWYLNDAPYSGYTIRCDDQGRILEQLGYYDGRKNGTAQFWYANGSLMKTAVYKNNKLHGRVIGYYPNGSIRTEGTYVEGAPEGIHTTWYETGQMARKRTLKAGQEDGLQQAWNANGSLYANYQVKNGRIFGLKRNNSCYALQNEELQY